MRYPGVMKTFWKFSLCSLVSLSLFGGEPEQERPRPMRITVRHIEAGGIGYNQGYTTLEGFFSPSKPFLDRCIPFLDVRGHVFNGGKYAANAGAGMRYLRSSRVWGWNAYYDYRNTNRQHYNQVAGGFESLGRVWDFRVNAYFPVGKKTSSFWGTRFDRFQGNFAIISRKREFALKGADAEAAAHVRAAKNIDFTFAGGPYYLTGREATAWGGRARVAIDLSQYCRLDGYLSYDHLFRLRGQGQLSLSLPFGGKRKLLKKESLRLSQRVVQPVERFEIIPVDRKRKNQVAIDPSTGQPYVFWFVSNTSHSSGTFESPFNNLAAAQNASSPGDVIYVYPGDGTTTGMNAGIVLKNDQSLFGAGLAQTLPISGGFLVIPAQASGMPSLTAPTGSTVVTVANNNTITGLQMAADAGGAISGCSCIGSSSGGVAGLSVMSNILTANNGAVGVLPHNPSGQVMVKGNTIQSADTQGAYVIYLDQTSGSGTYLIENNIISNFQNNTIFLPSVPSGTGVAILAENGAVVNATVSGNQVIDCVGNGIDLRSIGTGTPVMNALVENNQMFTNVLSAVGIYLFSNQSGNGNYQVIANTSRGFPFGLIGQAEDNSVMRGSIQSNVLVSGSSGSGIIVETNSLTPSGAAQGVFSIVSNDVSRFNAQGISTASFANSSLTATIMNNNVYLINKAGLYLNSFENSVSNLTILTNTLNENNGGMEIDVHDNATASVLVQRNTMNSNKGAGIFGHTTLSGSGKYEILSNTFSNNNISDLNTGSAVTMFSEDASNICLRMLYNQSTDEATQPDYSLTNSGTGQLRVEPLVGNIGTVDETNTTAVPSGSCGQ